MCFTIDRKRRPRVKIAKRSITVYKKLDPNGYPSHFSLIVKTGGKLGSEPYEEGATYTELTPFLLKKNITGRWFSGNEGFHSWSKAKMEGLMWLHEPRISIFKIPKGAKYYFHEGYYFSNKIKCVKLAK